MQQNEKTPEERMLALTEERKRKDDQKNAIAAVIFLPFVLIAGYIVYLAVVISHHT